VVDVEVRPGDHDRSGPGAGDSAPAGSGAHTDIGGSKRSGDEETGGRSHKFEASNRFVDKARSRGLEVALGAPHILTNPGARCEVPDSAAGERLLAWVLRHARTAAARSATKPQIPISGCDRRRAARIVETTFRNKESGSHFVVFDNHFQ
jgi:hypothetical protein